MKSPFAQQSLAHPVATHDSFRLPLPSKISTRSRPALLPLGAMVVAMVFQLDAHAQTATDTAVSAQGDVKETVLPTITVKEARDREAKGYQGGTTRIGKTAELPKDIPQSVTVISSQLMFERGNDTLKEALRNIAGLTFNAGEGGRIGDNINIRGYSAANDLFLDNIRDNAQYNRDLFNIEQADVLRGSASMLFGRGSTGGVVNQVSKRPFLSDQSEAQVTVGSNDYKRGTLDLNKVVGENAAIRINAMKTKGGSFRDGVSTDRTGLAMDFDWGIGTRDAFSLSYMHLEYDDTPDMGVPWYNNRALAVPVNRFYGRASDYQRDKADVATARWVHTMDKDTSLTTVVRASKVARDLHGSQPALGTLDNGAWSDSTVIDRRNQWRGGEDKSYTLQSDFVTKLEAAGFNHNIVAGVEYVQEDVQRWSWLNGSGGRAGSIIANSAGNTIGNPNLSTALPAGFLDLHQENQQKFTGKNLGLYAQDTLELTKHWKLLGGARFDKFSADSTTSTAFVPVDFNVWSYRTGLIYQPVENHTYYVSYGTSFNPSTESYTVSSATADLPPEENRNIELGGKWDLAEGDLSLRTAVFRSEKTNERNTDLTSSAVTLSGKRHTDGVEVEAAGRLTQNWEVFASAAWFRAEIDQAGIGASQNAVGKRPGNTPAHAYSLWTTYKLGGGWKIGGGLEAVGARTPADNYVNIAPSYTRWDAMASYDQETYYVKLNINNLFDTTYYESLYRGHVVPGTSRTAQLSVGLRF